jgi:hypothetical protein
VFFSQDKKKNMNGLNKLGTFSQLSHLHTFKPCIYLGLGEKELKHAQHIWGMLDEMAENDPEVFIKDKSASLVMCLSSVRPIKSFSHASSRKQQVKRNRSR